MTVTEINLYQVLGVPWDADADQIRRAFKTQVKRCHPDAGGDPETFRMVRIAYETLSDPKRRSVYDQEQVADAMWKHAPGPVPPPFEYRFADVPGAKTAPSQHRRSGRPVPVDPNRNRPQPGPSGRSYPGFRFAAATNRQLLMFRVVAAVTVFVVVWLRHVPLDAVLERVGFAADAVQFPVEVAFVAGVVAFVFGPKVWVWASTPGNRWKTVAFVAGFAVFEVVVAATLLAVGAAVFIGFVLVLSFGRLRRA